MKVYFVMPAPVGDDILPVFMYGKSLPIEAFKSAKEAASYAKRMAAEKQGEQFWIMEANPLTAFSSEPVPVFECKPEIGPF